MIRQVFFSNSALSTFDLDFNFPLFITNNVDNLKITDKLRANVERHYVVAESLAAYYKVAMKLDKPLIEYARYVVSKGSFEEKVGFTKGLQDKIIIMNSSLQLA